MGSSSNISLGSASPVCAPNAVASSGANLRTAPYNSRLHDRYPSSRIKTCCEQGCERDYLGLPIRHGAIVRIICVCLFPTIRERSGLSRASVASRTVRGCFRVFRYSRMKVHRRITKIGRSRLPVHRIRRLRLPAASCGEGHPNSARAHEPGGTAVQHERLKGLKSLL